MQILNKHKDIKQRIHKELCQLLPSILLFSGQINYSSQGSFINKQIHEQQLYKVIPCPSIPVREFKQAIQILNGLTNGKSTNTNSSVYRNNCLNDLTRVYDTLKQAEKFITGSVNIMQHNERVRRQYLLNQQKQQQQIKKRSKLLAEIIKKAQRVGSKSQFVEFINEHGLQVMTQLQSQECGDLSQQSTVTIGNYQSDRIVSSRKQQQQPKQINKLKERLPQLYLPLHADQFQFMEVMTEDEYLLQFQIVLQQLLVILTTIGRLGMQVQQAISTLTSQSQSLTHSQPYISPQFHTQLINMFTTLSTQFMFCSQNNPYNKLIKYLLQLVHNLTYNNIKVIQRIDKTAISLKQEFMRTHYLQFMSRGELKVVDQYLSKRVIDQGREKLAIIVQKCDTNDWNNILSKNVAHMITTQERHIDELQKQANRIHNYLVGSSHIDDMDSPKMRLFSQLYSRKLRKFLSAYENTIQLINQSRDITRVLKMAIKFNNEEDSRLNNGIGRRQMLVSAMKMIVVGDNVNIKITQQRDINGESNTIQQENNDNVISSSQIMAILSSLQKTVCNLQSKTTAFIKGNQQQQLKSRSIINNHSDNAHFIIGFTKLFRQSQQCQLKVAEKQLIVQEKLSYIIRKDNLFGLASINSQRQQVSRTVNEFKYRLLRQQDRLLKLWKEKTRHLSSNDNSSSNGWNLLQSMVINNNNNNSLEQSRFTQRSKLYVQSSSKSSSSSTSFLFYSLNQLNSVQQSDIIFTQEQLRQELSKSLSQQRLQIKQLITRVDGFVVQKVVGNIKLVQELEDLKNVDYSQLGNLLAHLQREIVNLGTQQQPNSTNQLNNQNNQSPNQNKTQPENNHKMSVTANTKSPQKNIKLSRQKRLQSKSPTKKQQTIGKINNNTVTTERANSNTNTKSTLVSTINTLTALKNKLTFIKDILICPQISQSNISKIFSHTVRLQIFQKLFFILKQYKLKLFTQNSYQEAQKYGLKQLLQMRVDFVNTLLKNYQQLNEIFAFVKMFSQRKGRFEPTSQGTYQIILKALLAAKQIEAYRRQNTDLAKLKKLSVHAVIMLDEQIYIPFITMFKSMLRVVSGDQSVVKELEEMLQHVRSSIKIKETLSQLLKDYSSNKQIKNHYTQSDTQSIVKRIQSILTQIISLKKFAIFKYKKLQKIRKTLKQSLTVNNSNIQNQQLQQQQQYILKYLRLKLGNC